MVNINELFLSVHKARAFIGEMYERWQPAAYGTKLSCRKNHDGTFEVTGYRFASAI